MSRMKKQNRMEKFAQGGLIPTPDPGLEAYRRTLLEQMRQSIQGSGSITASGFTIQAGVTAGTWNPNDRESKFAASEFAMGTAVGIRSWNVDRLGRLVSPSYRTLWTPTEMVAECKANLYTFYVGPSGASTVVNTEPSSPADHQQASCSCGFYAYYEGFNEYAQADRITGVIEGYGETQIGTRGFKSAKARIVALHVPDDSADLARIGKTPFSRVRENYGPHVATFSDYAQMAQEFPTTQPEDAPTPETDPDFWTRGI